MPHWVILVEVYVAPFHTLRVSISEQSGPEGICQGIKFWHPMGYHSNGVSAVLLVKVNCPVVVNSPSR